MITICTIPHANERIIGYITIHLLHRSRYKAVLQTALQTAYTGAAFTLHSLTICTFAFSEKTSLCRYKSERNERGWVGIVHNFIMEPEDSCLRVVYLYF